VECKCARSGAESHGQKSGVSGQGFNAIPGHNIGTQRRLNGSHDLNDGGIVEVGGLTMEFCLM
jgi:hypothetical protein